MIISQIVAIVGLDSRISLDKARAAYPAYKYEVVLFGRLLGRVFGNRRRRAVFDNVLSVNCSVVDKRNRIFSYGFRISRTNFHVALDKRYILIPAAERVVVLDSRIFCHNGHLRAEFACTVRKVCSVRHGKRSDYGILRASLVVVESYGILLYFSQVYGGISYVTDYRFRTDVNCGKVGYVFDYIALDFAPTEICIVILSRVVFICCKLGSGRARAVLDFLRLDYRAVVYKRYGVLSYCFFVNCRNIQITGNVAEISVPINKGIVVLSGRRFGGIGRHLRAEFVGRVGKVCAVRHVFDNYAHIVAVIESNGIGTLDCVVNCIYRSVFCNFIERIAIRPTRKGISKSVVGLSDGSFALIYGRLVGGYAVCKEYFAVPVDVLNGVYMRYLIEERVDNSVFCNIVKCFVPTREFVSVSVVLDLDNGFGSGSGIAVKHDFALYADIVDHKFDFVLSYVLSVLSGDSHIGSNAIERVIPTDKYVNGAFRLALGYVLRRDCRLAVSHGLR